MTLHEKLDALFRRYGCHARAGPSRSACPGREGMERMKALMARFRREPPHSLGGLAVTRVRDYLHNVSVQSGGAPQHLAGPTGDMVMLDLAAEGNYVAVRPSGTEPKVKFYMFAYEPPVGAAGDLAASRSRLPRDWTRSKRT